MPVDVYRCSHCGREVLVRSREPMSPQEIRRRIDEEMRPNARGLRGQRDMSTRLRDYIWEGVSGSREMVPRAEPPSACPSCHRSTLEMARTLDR
ncbi:MAG: hypothetical protein V3R95_03845 [Dehalococcoidia bacterium]